MTPRARMLAQIAYVHLADADAVEHVKCWPLIHPKPWEIEEADRLRGLADEFFTLAKEAGFNGGANAAFFGGAS